MIEIMRGFNVRLLIESEVYIDNYTMSAEGTSGIISISTEHEVSNCIIHRHITRPLSFVYEFPLPLLVKFNP